MAIKRLHRDTRKKTGGVIVGLLLGVAALLVTPPELHAQVPVVLICQDGSTQAASSGEPCKGQNGIDWRATQKWFELRSGRYATGDRVVCKNGQAAAASAKACASQGGMDTASTIAAVRRQAGGTQQATKPEKARAGADTAKGATKWGRSTDRQPEVQNPPGYRGMERPVNVFPPDSGKAEDAASGDATSRTSQMRRQDSTEAKPDQNPPGYRGMERPAGLEKGTAREGGDTSSTVRVGKDTTADSTRFEINSEEGDSTAEVGTASRDSVDIVHRRREVSPGVAYPPPPYPADSDRVWLEQRPSQDSVPLDPNK